MILEFFFDLASPYAYLGLTRMLRLAHETGGSLAWHPVDVEEVKRAAGNTGPPLRDLPAKQRYVQQDTARWARAYAVPPLSPMAGRPAPRLHRGTFLAIDRGVAPAYLHAAACRVWVDGSDPEDERVLRAVAQDMGWAPQELLEYTVSPEAYLRQGGSFARARQVGVFGVPTAVMGEQLWWGNDRLDEAEASFRRAREAARKD